MPEETFCEQCSQIPVDQIVYIVHRYVNNKSGFFRLITRPMTGPDHNQSLRGEMRLERQEREREEERRRADDAREKAAARQGEYDADIKENTEW
jgi:hypothetical protein